MNAARKRLLSLVPKGARSAEIGVFKGSFSAEILNTIEPSKLYLIDPWMNFDDPGLKGAWYHKGSDNSMDAIHESVKARFEPQIEAGVVEILRGKADEVIDTIEDGSLDFCYIDGDHRYEGVAIDLELAMRKVAPNGRIGMDDLHLGSWWGDGVIRAANEFLGTYSDRLRIEFAAGSQLLIHKHA